MPGLDLRLPTEEEWEYACRAGTTKPFSFGENITPEQVNYDGGYPYSGGKKGKNRGETVEVGSFPCNDWGLYEMHGNVWEWCSDWYGEYPLGPVVDPTGPEGGGLRVLRGGSWIDDGGNVRSADRGGDRRRSGKVSGLWGLSDILLVGLFERYYIFFRMDTVRHLMHNISVKPVGLFSS